MLSPYLLVDREVWMSERVGSSLRFAMYIYCVYITRSYVCVQEQEKLFESRVLRYCCRKILLVCNFTRSKSSVLVRMVL